MSERSLDALRTHIIELGKTGVFTEGSVRSYLTSIDRVFRDVPEVVLDNVFSVEIGELLSEFRESAARDNFELVTIHSYEGRVKAALKRFRQYVDCGYSPSEAAETRVDAGVRTPRLPVEATLCLPLRPGVTIEVEGLPFDLTPAEAKRIANVIVAMAAGQ